MLRRAPLAALLLLPLAHALALDPLARIRDEGFNRSEVMDLAFQLTDAVGPRLTNSEGIRQAQANALAALKRWGAGDAHLEPWGPFGPGWQVTHLQAEMLEPAYVSLIAYAKAWSSPTKGVIEGAPVYLDAPTAADLARYRGKLAGRIVLLAPVRDIVAATPPARWTDAGLLELAQAPAATPPYRPTAAQRAAGALNAAKWQLIHSERPAVVLEPGGGGGTVYVTAAYVPAGPEGERNAWDPNRPYVVPQMVVASEQYNRLVRLTMAGKNVRLRLEIAVANDATHQPDNLIAQLPGTDRKDEVVMFGGTLDSWHTATGATDNASGAAASLEAMRILAALHLPTRRTIRLGLWSGEEQGALGSKAWVAAHHDEHIVAYFNLDWGPGRIRGLYLQGIAGALPVLRDALAPLADLGASTVTLRSIGASDHVSFNNAGIPGFQFIRDFMETSGGPNHTNMDLYERLEPADLRQAAVVAATVVYTLAQQTEELPRPKN